MNQEQNIEFKVLQYNAAVINYGGRVTDDKDDRLIRTFVKKFVCPEMLSTETEYFFDTEKQ